MVDIVTLEVGICVLGSNIFNGFGIGGLMGLVGPGKIEEGSILGTLEVASMLGVVGLSSIYNFYREIRKTRSRSPDSGVYGMDLYRQHLRD